MRQNVRFVRKAIAILLLFSVMVRPFTQAYYLIDYQLRKGFITKTFCINKDRPQLNCNGKCYLAQRLKAAEEQETKAQHTIFEKYEIPTMICEEFTNLQFQLSTFKTTTVLYTYTNYYTGAFAALIFQPPRLA